jgi:hypothetical protein
MIRLISVRLTLTFVLASVCTGLILMTVAPGQADAVGRTGCGSTHAFVGGLRLGGPVRASDVSCREAKRVIHYALTHARGNAPLGPTGWICARGGSPRVSRIALACHRRNGKGRAWLLNRAL